MFVKSPAIERTAENEPEFCRVLPAAYLQPHFAGQIIRPNAFRMPAIMNGTFVAGKCKPVSYSSSNTHGLVVGKVFSRLLRLCFSGRLPDLANRAPPSSTYSRPSGIYATSGRRHGYHPRARDRLCPSQGHDQVPSLKVCTFAHFSISRDVLYMCPVSFVVTCLAGRFNAADKSKK